MALADLTPTAVLRAIEEYDRLGQDAFLRRYGFRRALRYVLVHDGRRYDSKAIAGAAHGHLDGRDPLRPRDFSGGASHAAGLLRGLGFKVVDDAATDAALGQLLDRLGALRVSRAAGRPALHQPIVLLWAVGRAARGEPRILPWAETEQALGALLLRHGLRRERPRPDGPVAALHRAGLWELTGHTEPVPRAHGDAALRGWFRRQRPDGGLDAEVYALLGGSAGARSAVVETLLGTYFVDLEPGALLEAVGLGELPCEQGELATPHGSDPHGTDLRGALLAAEYDRLSRMAEAQQPVNRGRRTPRSAAPVRSAEARRAVLLRSGRRCENPRCTGAPDDVTVAGEPILEVDHVLDLAGGGPDLPDHMVALCPNCHAVKTRGRTGEELRAVLLDVARSRHARLLRGVDG
ncbi:HNH endonuclease signature motif containing protein [Streptomyces catenulae]|uniref:HNH endonuclease signature motif containing protein n=1 Tax=Streptomyces catenulae TaxID=66875 RepID=A0ABV2Z3R7_9ACTN|nr:HNH endonuclease signature motif containing protein [Streptomyces catenulae]